MEPYFHPCIFSRSGHQGNLAGITNSPEFRHSGARVARARNPYQYERCGPMDSGPAPSGASRNDGVGYPSDYIAVIRGAATHHGFLKGGQ
jgi:hypothetical protein